MTHETNQNIQISIEPLTDTLPFCEIYNYLEAVWKNEFKTSYSITSEIRGPYEPNQIMDCYNHAWGIISFALIKAGQIAQDRGAHIQKLPVFTSDTEGKITLSNNATKDMFHRLSNQKPLHNISILCIGGIEGRVLADLGANVVNIDPLISNIPSIIDRPTLLEISDYFSTRTTQKLINNNKGHFDIAIASWIFDRGSGFDPFSRFMFSPVTDSEIEIYSNGISTILSILNKGGYFIANGDMIHHALKNINANSIQAYPHFKDDTIASSSELWVIQK